MEQSKQQRIRELTGRLNRCRYEYYNLNAPSLTDAEYDALFDELSTLEKETGFSMTNSPTQTVTKIRTNGETLKSASCEDCPDEKGKVDASNSWSAMKIAISEANAQFIALCHIE